LEPFSGEEFPESDAMQSGKNFLEMW
jgi:hypothetical protein